ncbi:hypothetical protein C8R44DRAFT_427053 [Mycena epipterygia]|nr:hypothetical protein C8R44DRAFT_427053 [Mycena epipterygia]
MRLWHASLLENFQGELPVKRFLETYLPPPQSELGRIHAIVTDNAVVVALTKAVEEASKASVEDALIHYLDAVVRSFPEDHKPSFGDTHSTTTFPPIDLEDHYTMPDITATRPGKCVPPKWAWPYAGTVLELKIKVDIFKKGIPGDSREAKDGLTQLAKSARSLLTSSGARFVFVVAVRKTKARILHFDRAGYRTSEAFNWSKKTDVLPRFFWRLYNPDPDPKGNQARMYGDDDTISVPTLEEKEKMYKLWQKTLTTPPNESLSFEKATEHSRWVKAMKIRDGKDAPVRGFTIGPPISQSSDLFGRATRVDRVIIEDDLLPVVYALKDAWPKVCRRPEVDFYDVIHKYCAENNIDTHGMARCLGSVELFEHRTNSAECVSQDRRHMRSLLTPVGAPLKTFKSAKQLICIMEKAVAHHETAYEAGVLHRDVSEGNVLFDETTLEGFLVDWDYAEFTQDGLRNFEKWFPDRARAPENQVYRDIHKSLKDRTGTYPFLTIELLEKPGEVVHEPKHDLESFYWLLVWIVLRYTAHTDEAGALACHELFEIRKPAVMKRNWILEKIPLPDFNSPLYKLMVIIRMLVIGQNPSLKLEICNQAAVLFSSRVPPSPPAATAISYEDMRLTFESVQSLPGWETYMGATALPFIAPRIETVELQLQTGTKTKEFRQTVLENAQATSAGGHRELKTTKKTKRPRDEDGGAGSSSASTSAASGSASSVGSDDPQSAKKPRISQSMKGKKQPSGKN